jgi:hypothetical protein
VSRDVQIAGAAGAAPQSYTVPNATEIIPLCIRAVFNGTGAAGAFLPTVEIVSDGGVVIGTFPTDTAVAAGGSAEVTFAPFLRNLVTGAGGFTYDQLIIALGVDAFYKLDETSGSTAHDSSGNGHDISSTTVDPAWATGTSPVGTTAPAFSSNHSLGGVGATLTYSPNLAGDFTACGWINASGASENQEEYMIAQGDTPTFGSRGWALYRRGDLMFQAGKSEVDIGNGAGGANSIWSDSATTNAGWVHLAVVHSGSTWTQYVDGVAQAATFGGVYASTVDKLVIAKFTGAPILLSYVCLFARALPQAAITALAGV